MGARYPDVWLPFAALPDGELNWQPNSWELSWHSDLRCQPPKLWLNLPSVAPVSVFMCISLIASKIKYLSFIYELDILTS